MPETTPPTAAELREEYQRLVAICGGFDLESRKLERQWTDELKARKDARKGERAALLSRKGAVAIAMREAEAREEREVEAAHVTALADETEKIAGEPMIEEPAAPVPSAASKPPAHRGASRRVVSER